MDRLRTFIAVELAPELLPGVLDIQREILGTGGDIKGVEPENIHFTLKFLGEIPQSTVNEVMQCMNGLDFKSFEIEVSGVGCFPTIRNPRVVWIGVTDGLEDFSSLSKQLENCLKSIGLPPERERFTAHLTIGRVRSGRNKAELMRKLAEDLNVKIGRMTVSAVKLKKSTLTPKGPIYTTLHEVRGN
ncbi:MAG: RNA 2',3'-cyclic phosphodiesterase [Promethearchaeati archaeon SRVP18_Atabeyarchaeia-1]